MLKVGLVNLDTSHVIAFSQRMHHKGVPEEQWVDGAITTHAFRGDSNVRTPEQVEEYAQQLKNEFGVTLVDRLEDMIDLVDVVCIEANEGWRHLELATPFLKAGKRCFIDKPFGGNYTQARQMYDLAKEHGAAIMSCSSLRFGDELIEFVNTHGRENITGVDAITPSPYHWANPGLLHYGIHGVEILFALMGPGCLDVRSLSVADQELCVGRWADGRIGSLRGCHNGPWQYGFRATVRGEKPAVYTVQVNAGSIYRNMIREMVKFFQTGESCVPVEETLEIMGYMDAAAASAKLCGVPAAMPWI